MLKVNPAETLVRHGDTVLGTHRLDMLADLDRDHHMPNHHRLHAVRAHLLEQAGEHAAAQAAFTEAARRATSIPEQRYLQAQTARLTANNPD